MVQNRQENVPGRLFCAVCLSIFLLLTARGVRGAAISFIDGSTGVQAAGSSFASFQWTYDTLHGAPNPESGTFTGLYFVPDASTVSDLEGNFFSGVFYLLEPTPVSNPISGGAEISDALELSLYGLPYAGGVLVNVEGSYVAANPPMGTLGTLYGPWSAYAYEGSGNPIPVPVIETLDNAGNETIYNLGSLTGDTLSIDITWTAPDAESSLFLLAMTTFALVLLRRGFRGDARSGRGPTKANYAVVALLGALLWPHIGLSQSVRMPKGPRPKNARTLQAKPTIHIDPRIARRISLGIERRSEALGHVSTVREPISHTVDRQEVARLGGVRLDLVADVLDVSVDGAFI